MRALVVYKVGTEVADKRWSASTRHCEFAYHLRMFLKLCVTPMPDIDSGLTALDAARVVCALAGVPPLITWRDSVSLEHWYASAHPEDMVSDDELLAADVGHSALAAARASLRLPVHIALDIEVVIVNQFMGMPELHGPDRYIWRLNWMWYLEKWARDTLDNFRPGRAADGLDDSE